MKILKIAFVWGSVSLSVFGQCGGLALQRFLESVDVPADAPDVLEVLQDAHDCINPCGDKLCRCNLSVLRSLVNERLQQGIHGVRKRCLNRLNDDLGQRLSMVHRAQYSPSLAVSAVASVASSPVVTMNDPTAYYVTWADLNPTLHEYEVLIGNINTTLSTLSASVSQNSSDIFQIQSAIANIKDYTSILSEISGKLSALSNIQISLSSIDGKISQINTAIASGNSSLSSIDTKLSALSGMSSALSDVNTKIGSISYKLDNYLPMINTGIASVKDSVDIGNTKLSAIDSGLYGLKTSFDNQASFLMVSLNTFDSYFQEIYYKLVSVNDSMSGMQSSIDSVKASVDGMKTAVESMNTLVSGLGSDIGEIETSTYKLRNMDVTLNSIKTAVDLTNTKLGTYITSIYNASLAINEKSQYIRLAVENIRDSKLSPLTSIDSKLSELSGINQNTADTTMALGSLSSVLSFISSDVSSILGKMSDSSSGGSTEDISIEGLETLQIAVDKIVAVQESFRDKVLDNFADYDSFFDEYKQAWDGLDSKQFFLQKQEKVFTDMETAAAGVNGEHDNYWSKFAQLVREYGSASTANPEPEVLAGKGWFERMEFYLHKLVMADEEENEQPSDFSDKEAELTAGFGNIEKSRDTVVKSGGDFTKTLEKINADILGQFGFLKKVRSYPKKFTLMSPGAANSGGPLLFPLMQNGGLIVTLDDGLESYITGFRSVICFCWGGLFLFAVFRSVTSFVVPAISYLVNILNNL